MNFCDVPVQKPCWSPLCHSSFGACAADMTKAALYGDGYSGEGLW